MAKPRSRHRQTGYSAAERQMLTRPVPELPPPTSDEETEDREAALRFFNLLGAGQLALATRDHLDRFASGFTDEDALAAAFSMEREVEVAGGRDNVVLLYDCALRVEDADAALAAIAQRGLPHPLVVQAGPVGFLAWRGRAEPLTLAATLGGTRRRIRVSRWVPIPGLLLREGKVWHRATLTGEGASRGLKPSDLSALRTAPSGPIDGALIASRLGVSVLKSETTNSFRRKHHAVTIHHLSRCPRCGKRSSAIYEYANGNLLLTCACGRLGHIQLLELAGLTAPEYDRSRPRTTAVIEISARQRELVLPILTDAASVEDINPFEPFDPVPAALTVARWARSHGLKYSAAYGRFQKAAALSLIKKLPPSPDDRRKRSWVLTRKGKSLLWGEWWAATAAALENPAAMLNEPKQDAVVDVEAWLRQKLPGLASEIKEAAAAAGIKPKRLRTARERIRVRFRPAGDRKWLWY